MIIDATDFAAKSQLLISSFLRHSSCVPAGSFITIPLGKSRIVYLDFSKWKKPPCGTVKINVDASLYFDPEARRSDNSQFHEARIGVLGRDSDGSHLFSESLLDMAEKVHVAEKLAIGHGVSALNKSDFSNFIVEGDNHGVVNKYLYLGTKNVEFNPVYRHQNQGADFLAKLARLFTYNSEKELWVPLELQQILEADLLSTYGAVPFLQPGGSVEDVFSYNLLSDSLSDHLLAVITELSNNDLLDSFVKSAAVFGTASKAFSVKLLSATGQIHAILDVDVKPLKKTGVRIADTIQAAKWRIFL